MLYLAEVVQRKGGIIGGSKTELKLLACQRSEQSWSAVPGEDTIPADDANKYNPGALVLVDLTSNKQVQRVQEASRQLVSILQNFSRLQEKFKTQEEEIEQWKQSLTYQSQELNRREMEMESRREQLLQMEEDFEQLEQQRQEIEQAREEITRIKEESDRNRQELEGAWEHLRGEMRRLEERQSEIQQSAVLDDDNARNIQDLLNRLAGSVAPTESVREQLNLSFELINQQQELLNYHWQRLEQQREEAQKLQAEVDRQTQQLQSRWQEWHQSQESLEQAKAELKAQQNVLSSRQDYAQALGVQLQQQEELHQQLYRLAETSDRVSVTQKIDIEALEKMALPELERFVRELHQDLDQFSRFVNDQEEELTLKQQEIDELHAKIQAASEYDRLSIEAELADEQDSYQMLNDTLEGQRRTLREREEILHQHQAVLRRRQGISDGDGQESKIDLGPILLQLDSQRHQQTEELHRLEGQIEQMRGAIQQAQGMINNQSTDQENKRNELKQLEQNLQKQRSDVAELWGKVNLYQETLQPIQDGVSGLRQRLEEIAGTMSQVQEAGDYQLQAITEMRQILVGLMNTPELAAS
ncbi:MAG: pilus motility taxis protein HmpF [Scytolyngbya sp. HA4215-MV1]|nr:pilus motility taxis protein HmpF [Scytolyngbya sp. HA4215-MV1]